jgi:hypothetical protein
VSSVISTYADRALRVILVAYKDIATAPPEEEEELATDLIISAFVGIMVRCTLVKKSVFVKVILSVACL